MGFCGRCGDIVVGARCRCGGRPVAPAVKWNEGDNAEVLDKWSRVYVTREAPPTQSEGKIPAKESAHTRPLNASDEPCNRFPRPPSDPRHTSNSFGSQVSAHIANVTAPRSPPPQRSFLATTDSNAERGILPNPHRTELAKVYGSVLQPPETLGSFACAICCLPFPPDATIFPDPSASLVDTPSSRDMSSRFLCRPCFTLNGGSKGDCLSCRRPVLTLKSEGGFIEMGGKVWHKKCFFCDGCSKYLGDSPMVDLLGRPSCAGCFDSCLKRPAKTTADNSDPGARSNIGGSKRNMGREGSPALEELEQRLGIIRGKESAPKTEEYRDKPTPRTSVYQSLVAADEATLLPGRRSYARLKSPEPEPSSSPSRRDHSGPTFSTATSAQPTEEAIEEMKRRFLNQASPASKALYSSDAPTPDATPARRSRSRPRVSDTFAAVTDDPVTPAGTTPPHNSRSSTSSVVAPSPTLRSPSSASSLRSAVRQSTSTAQVYPLPEPTGESVLPLLIDRTGTPEYCTSLDFNNDTITLQEHSTGSVPYLSRTTTGETTRALRRQRTGESLGSQHTGFGVFSQTTGSSSLPLRSQKTGETIYEVRMQRTGEVQLRSHRTGEVELRYQTSDSSGYVTERSGDAEVESLVGALPATEAEDLIDLSSVTSSESLSKIPVLSKASRALLGTYDRSVPPTPDLASDLSDSISVQSSGPSTPPSTSPTLRKSHDGDLKEPLTSEAASRQGHSRRLVDVSQQSPTSQPNRVQINTTVPPQSSSNARCATCMLPLFSIKHGGKYVTVPEPSSSGAPPKTHHISCFRCIICHGVFEEKEGGHAVFVRGEDGACHVKCAPPEKITLRRAVDATSLLENRPPSQLPVPVATRTRSQTISVATSSRYEPPPKPTVSPGIPSRRFGAPSFCPGCNLAVSQMERGVVLGPQSSRWHATCLICGGKEIKGRRKEDGKPGCGKRLDSAAKLDPVGNAWCRECLLLLPLAQRQPPPSRPLVTATTTGSRDITIQPTGTRNVALQSTGTTIARQFTGLGGPDPDLLRQLTGGGLSPTRQLSSSPTKSHDGPRPGAARYPRPKSATGVRSTNGEGRGMFLIRQLTGGNTSFSGNDYGL